MSCRLTFSGFFLSLLFAITAVLSGCGGGGASAGGTTGGTPVATPGATISGTAATGAAMAGATITVKDSTGAIVGTATAGSDGAFSVTLSSTVTPPLILQAVPPSPYPVGSEQYSIFVGTPSATNSSLNRVNITPATSLVVYEATKKNLSNLFSISPTDIAGLTNAIISQAEQNVIAQFPLSLGALSDTDLLHQVFTGGSQTGYDAALDSMGVTTITFASNGDTPTLKTTGGATVPYIPTNPLFPISSVLVAAGSPTQTADGAALNQISATVTDTTSSPAKGVLINFSTTAGSLVDSTGAVVSSAVTDSSGVARLKLKSSTRTGDATVTATSNDNGSSGLVKVTFTPGAPAAIGLNAMPSSLSPGGTTTLTAMVVDANGNLVADGQNVKFTTSSTNNGKFGNLPIVSLITASGGVSVVYTAGGVVGSESITAQTTNGIFTTIPLTLSVNAAAVTNVALSASSPSIAANGVSQTNLFATVTGGAGPVPGATVTFTSSAGTLSSSTATTNSLGVATVALTSGTNVLTAQATASVAGYTATPVYVNFTAGTAAAVGVNAAPSAVQPGGASTITASVLDGNGNPVANEPVSFSFSPSGSTIPSLSATSGTTNANGLVSVTYTAGTCSGSCTDVIRVRTSNNSTTTTSINVSSANAVVGSVTATATNPSIPAGGATTTIRATVLDVSNAPLKGISVTFATTAGSLSSPTATTDSNGNASVTLTSGTALLAANVTASAGGYTGSATVNFTAGAPSAVTVSAAPATVKPGGNSSVYAYVTDANNNPVVGETVTFSFTARGSGFPALGAGSAVTNANGLATLSYTAGSTSGSDTIQAITSNAKIGVAAIAVSSTATVVNSLALTAGATTLPADGASPVNIRATVLDINGVPAAGIPVSFSTSAGTLSGPSATTGANGVAQVTLTSPTNLGTAIIVANASGFSQTVSVTFVAGSPVQAKFSLSASPSSVSVSSNSALTAVVLDTNGNPVVGQTVTFAITPNTSGASLASVTAVTNANGLATTIYTAGVMTGADTVKATLTSGVTANAGVTVTAGATANMLSIATNQTSVKSDNSNPATITVTALNSNNVVVPGVTINFTASGGQLSAGSAVTAANGQATVTVSSGSSDMTNRTVTVNAVAATGGAAAVSIPIQIVGSSLTPSTPSTNLTVGNTVSLKVTARDAGGKGIYNAPVAFSASGTGTATLTPASGLTDVNGDVTISVAATGPGSLVVTATGVGVTATQAYTFTATTSSLIITAPSANPAALVKDTPLVFTATAPAPIANVRFSATLGTWTTCPGGTAGTAVCLTPVVPGVPPTATATLTSTLAGTANILAEGLDGSGKVTTSDTRIVGITSAPASAAAISLQSSVAVLAPSSGGTTNSATLTATVRDAGNQPVGNALVAYSILNPTGGGEVLLPVVQTTSDGTSGIPLGQAKTSFTSGSLPSTGDGVVLQAMVVGSGNGVCPALPPAPPGPGTAFCATTKINIGGTAGSIAIGTSTLITDVNSTTYALPMSLLVSDSNGNPVVNTVVTLSAWPVYYWTGTHIAGTPCSDGYNNGPAGGITGGFVNEDDLFGFGTAQYENLILDAGEDGNSVNFLNNGVIACTGCLPYNMPYGPSLDGKLTPPNSAAGSLPATVTTDSNGLANFNLTYLKQYATWITDRIRAKTLVQGTEATAEITFRLPPTKSDLESCTLPQSPFN